MKQYHVYILASKTRRLYVGMTSDLARRIWEHKTKALVGFTSRYNIDRLVWCEATENAAEATASERRIKGWRHEKKVALIERDNPEWLDLANDW